MMPSSPQKQIDKEAVRDFADLLRMLANTLAAQGKVSAIARRAAGQRISRPGHLHPIYELATLARRDPERTTLAVAAEDAIVVARRALFDPPRTTPEILVATVERLEALSGGRGSDDAPKPHGKIEADYTLSNLERGRIASKTTLRRIVAAWRGDREPRMRNNSEVLSASEWRAAFSADTTPRAGERLESFNLWINRTKIKP